MAQLKEIPCKQCGGTMKEQRRTKHSQVVVLLLFLVGLVFLPFVFPIGIILLLVAVAMNESREKCWVCSQCETKILKA